MTNDIVGLSQVDKSDGNGQGIAKQLSRLDEDFSEELGRTRHGFVEKISQMLDLLPLRAEAIRTGRSKAYSAPVEGGWGLLLMGESVSRSTRRAITERSLSAGAGYSPKGRASDPNCSLGQREGRALPRQDAATIGDSVACLVQAVDARLRAVGH